MAKAAWSCVLHPKIFLAVSDLFQDRYLFHKQNLKRAYSLTMLQEKKI